jgi:hypothetical protein
MSFSRHLERLGLLHDNGEGGGGGRSRRRLEDLTNEKITGTLDEPEATDQPDPGGEPESKKLPDPEPEPKAKQDPAPKDEPEPTQKTEATSDPAPKDGVDQPEPDGNTDEFFYDPERHVEGKPAHTNKFKTRENGEYAAVQKAALLKETIEKGKKDGIDRGAIPLPTALNGSEEALDNLTNLETVVAMDDDELRNFLNESDAFRQRLEEKYDRKKQEIESRKANDRFEQLQVETFDNLKKLMPVEEVQANLDKFADADKGKEFTKAKVNEKVKQQLESDRKDLDDWIDKVDSGEIEMSYKEFDKEKTARLEALQRKEREIRSQYEPIYDQIDELYELSQDIDQNKGLTPQEKREKMWNAFDEFQADRSGDLSILADSPEARAELVSFKQWAVQNAADFNDLLHPNDFNKAILEWENFKERVRAQRQKKALNGDQPKSKTSASDSDIPNPGDQEKIKGGRDKSVQDVRRRSMDKLVELTNATIGT